MIGVGRADGWHPGPDCYWESWSRNGEVCITGLDPPVAGGTRLASCLTWLLRSFASHCRLTHDATGALAFTCTSPRMPSALAVSMALSFDLALRDPKLIRARVRRRGGVGVRGRLPALWLEGSVYEYVVGRDAHPAVGTARRRILLLAEERQAFAPCPAGAGLPAAARRAWADGLDGIADIDDASVAAILENDAQAFAVNLFVLVHRWPAAKVHARPTLDESYRRHQVLINELATDAAARDLSLPWNALWRLPPAMTCVEHSGTVWMRCPAVSVAVAGRPILPQE